MNNLSVFQQIEKVMQVTDQYHQENENEPIEEKKEQYLLKPTESSFKQPVYQVTEQFCLIHDG